MQTSSLVWMSELFVGLDKPKVVLISNYIQKFCIIQTEKEDSIWKGNYQPFEWNIDYHEMIEIISLNGNLSKGCSIILLCLYYALCLAKHCISSTAQINILQLRNALKVIIRLYYNYLLLIKTFPTIIKKHEL